MSLTVKAYLTKAGQEGSAQPEIRRFGVDADVSSSYNYLVSKINAVFPGLAFKTITLSWKDADNDTIVFSSDEELIEALSYVNDGIFKLYIEEKVDTQTAAPPAGAVLHPRITCDGCEGPVRGIRYKCEVCADYDLCEACKSTGLHSEHKMKTIEKPKRWNRWNNECMMMPGMPPMFGMPHGMPPGMPPPPFGCPPAPFGCPPPQYETGTSFPAPGMPPSSCPRPDNDGNNQPTDDYSAQCNRRMVLRAWRRYYRQCFGDDFKRKCHKGEKRCKKQEKKDKKKEKKRREESAKEGVASEGGAAATAEKKEKDSSSSDSSSSDEAEKSPTEDYLKTVGQSVADMLDPLGIDVEVDVEHNGERRRCHGGRHGWAGGMRGHGGPWGPGGPWGYGGPWGRGGQWGFGGRGGGCPWSGRGPWGAPQSGTAEGEATPAQPEAAPWGHGGPCGRGGPRGFGGRGGGCLWTGRGPWGAPQPGTAQAEAASAQQEAAPASQAPAHDPETNSETGELKSTTTAENATAPHRSADSPDGADWMFVQSKAGDVTTEVDGVACGVENLHMTTESDSVPPAPAYSSLTPAASLTLTPVIAQSLATMKELGFSDDGGWLTALLVAHNGDIGHALDAMNAKK